MYKRKLPSEIEINDRNYNDYNTMDDAASYGTLENMKWLYKLNKPFSENTFTFAALSDNIETMKWLYALQVLPTVDVFNAAAFKGNLDNMKWLLEIGCPYDKTTVWYFVEHYVTSENGIDNGVDILEWFKENKFPCSTDLLKRAKLNGNQKNIDWIINNLDNFNFNL